MTGSSEFFRQAEKQFLQCKRESFQESAWGRLQEMQRPSRKTDSYSYVNLNPLYKRGCPLLPPPFRYSLLKTELYCKRLPRQKRTLAAS